VNPVPALAEKLDQPQVPKHLKLLPNLLAHVPIRGMQMCEALLGPVKVL